MSTAVGKVQTERQIATTNMLYFVAFFAIYVMFCVQQRGS
jgi:hypothetical protein